MTRTVLRWQGSRRTAALWAAATAVGLVVVVALALASGEDPRLVLGLTGAMVLLGGAAVARAQQAVETGGPEPVLVQRRLLRTSRVGLHTARSVVLRPNFGGSAQLLATGRDGSSAFAPLLLLSQYAEVQQPARVVEALLSALEGSRAQGAEEVHEQLRQQLEHLRRGGSPATSPLAPLAVDVTRGAGGFGAAGGTASGSDLF